MMLSLVWLVWLALMPELTESVDERNKMALNNQYFLIIGAFPVLIAFLIFESGLITFQIFVGICALLCGICYYYIGSKLKERPEFHINQPPIPLLRALKEVLKSRSYITMTLFRIFNQLNGALGFTFIFAYIYVLKVDIVIASLLFYVLNTLIALIGYLIYKKLSMKHEMRTLIIRGRSVQITLSVIGFFIILIPELEILIWVFLVAGFITGGFMLFDYPVMMLVTDEDEINYGERREGLILGTNAFFNKIAESVGPIIGTTVLLLFSFNRDNAFQPPIAIIGIKFLFLVVQSIINFLGLISIYYFPLYGETLKELQNKLILVHEEKKQIYNSKDNL
jgi:GPH family glycoside/pentoside/hexuronide:cation symporter